MNKMNPEVKAKWAAALRSGEYQQSGQQLRNGFSSDLSHRLDNTFCCLGVLTDLYAKEHGTSFEELAVDDQSAPPLIVCRWAGFERGVRDPTVDFDGENHRSLSELNDGGGIRVHSFEEIASIIEENL